MFPHYFATHSTTGIPGLKVHRVRNSNAVARPKAMSNAPWNLVNTIGDPEWLFENRGALMSKTPHAEAPYGYGVHLRLLGVAWRSNAELIKIIYFLKTVLFVTPPPDLTEAEITETKPRLLLNAPNRKSRQSV